MKVTGSLTAEQEQQFRDGVPLMRQAHACRPGLKLIREGENPWYEVKLTEGRNNQIRLMFKHFGLLVEKLKRVRIGPLELGPLKPGEFRYLTDEEVEKLKRAIQRGQKAPRSRKPYEPDLRNSAHLPAPSRWWGSPESAFGPATASRSTCSAPGYRIIPVNPHETRGAGRDVLSGPGLDSRAVDIVDIFRRSEFVPEIVEAAIRKGAKAIWMQEGVYHEAAARRAEEAGLAVVMDRCILKDHRRLAYAS